MVSVTGCRCVAVFSIHYYITSCTPHHTHTATPCVVQHYKTHLNMYTVAPVSYTHIHTYIRTYSTRCTIHTPHTNTHIQHTSYTHTHYKQMDSPTNSGVPTIVRALPFFSMLRSLADPKSTNLIVELPSRARTMFSGCKPHKIRETHNDFLHRATSRHRLNPLNTGTYVGVGAENGSSLCMRSFEPLSPNNTRFGSTL